MKITIDKLKELSACKEGAGLEFFRMTLGRSAELEDVLNVLLEQSEYEWIRWLVRKVLNRREKVKLAVWTAEYVLPLFEAEFPEDKRPREAIKTVKRRLAGKADIEELEKVADTVYWVTATVEAAAAVKARAAGEAKRFKNKAEFYKKYAKKALKIIKKGRF